MPFAIHNLLKSNNNSSHSLSAFSIISIIPFVLHKPHCITHNLITPISYMEELRHKKHKHFAHGQRWNMNSVILAPSYMPLPMVAHNLLYAPWNLLVLEISYITTPYTSRISHFPTGAIKRCQLSRYFIRTGWSGQIRSSLTPTGRSNTAPKVRVYIE